jgi:phospholipase C
LEGTVLRTIRTASILAIITASTAFIVNGCGERTSSTANNGATGSVNIALVQGGVTINTVSYTISGNGFSKMGTIDVSHSSALATVIGGIPAGSGYSIMLSATGTDGSNCGGNATFAVTPGAVTNVSVTLDCHQAAKTGSISLNGTVNICPNLDALSASPASVNVGATLSLSAAADDPDSGPSPLAYSWTATANGAFVGPTNTANATFECTSVGTSTVTVTVSDGDPLTSCAATGSVTVTCTGHNDAALLVPTATPIKHAVIIFGENISYDHYFGTYPNAANPAGEPAWPASTAPANNNLVAPLDPTAGFTPIPSPTLLTMNPNLNSANGTGAANPFRLGVASAWTKSQGHNYLPEQEAMDNGLMDLYPKFTGSAGAPPSSPPAAATALTTGLVMGYYDGNELQTWWSLAQQYALNDNSFSTNFGPSTPGCLNLISGQTNGVGLTNKAPSTFATSHVVQDGVGGYTVIGDTDPLNDVCSAAADQNLMTGPNIGDLLNAKSLTWGWFNGGFDLTVTNANGTTMCKRSTPQTPAGSTVTVDYVPHHQPFMYYASTANPSHARPTGTIGTTDAANHQYDLNDFYAALSAGTLPSVTYLKAPAFQDGHPSNSNPTDEQNFVASVYNALKASQEWTSTALIMLYDDSDGWYDHQQSPIVNPSTSAADALNSFNMTTGIGVCNSGKQQGTATPATPLNGVGGTPVQGRCGYGPRQPLLIASPYAKKNYIDHTLTDQSSVLKFVEDNWLGGQRIQPGGSFDTIAGTIQNMFTF